MKQTSPKNISKDAGSYNNRRCFGANGFSLLPLALRPRLFVVIILSVFINIFTACCSVSTFATTSTLNVTIANSISLDLAPTSSNGTFTSSSTTNNITISTDNYTGYTLGTLAKTANSNALINQQDNTITLPSITTNVSEANYQNDTYKDIYNNTWGYKPSKYYDTTNDTIVVNTNSLYFPAPTSTTNQTILAKTTSANTFNSQANQLESDGYNIAIGARVNSDTAAGAYENVFVITVVANPIPYSITYNANAGNDSSLANMPSVNPQTGSVDSTTPTITLASAPTRNDYKFLGWCTVQVTANTACTGTEYAAGSTYTIDYTNSNTFTLYARWGQLLYSLVAEQVKTINGVPRTQTAAELQATITTPTSSDPATDTSNSGVYLYNAGVFGTASDASNDYPIYYYRGILDDNFASTDSNGNIGSSGDSTYYQNYVILDANSTKDTSDTCWRIIRTTGSGGVKMIYNGRWTGTTCANAQTAAQVTTGAFNSDYASIGGTNYTGLQYQNMHAIGYTYSTVAAGTTTQTALSTLLGSSGDDTNTNSMSSTIKQYIEGGWFNSAIGSYESILEPNAGYCNDRTVYPNNSYELANKIAEITEVIPYGTSNMTVYRYGAYARNAIGGGNSQTPSLTCPRGIVDIYSTTTTSGGNGQLSKPVALLTADEMSLAGSGRSIASQGSTYNVSSYLRSGSGFWLLSPLFRFSNGCAGEFLLISDGVLDFSWVNSDNGARPAVSLKHDISPASGSGTATDPWVVSAP